MPLEPVVLVGEGEYNLNVLTDIKVTESYLNLDQNIRNCQNEESFDNCTTKRYLDNVQEQCGCLPIGLSNNVSIRLDKWNAKSTILDAEHPCK